MAKDKRPSVKNEEQYEALRDQGYSKEKSARIANSDSSKTGKKGGKSPKYEEWTKEELYDKAQEIGIENRSKMSKEELIDALRNH
ncbi:Rho termination factor N-terminal domain-containing protein [Litoribacter ruber]|uniref:Rho termination factor N-terminal domain-containing protein n=1 Tax=Litoribacter ruber TaxID=702568 RepID=A0AAP2G4F1_9BACT|nr:MULTISPECIES: Rho termination factor N-terminal domain-containing protein [Litoribacter]MBS9524435.1 Rho termination factor N-terminal domain-containing protein [Litoribacter alkaliphilus]MBT0810411.1 Rho termination factor N-terminal domain-containing protein [Litoribacter ruber]